MNCTDLERYLEAFLDGRLGRARAGLLRRHIAGCASCRQRVDALQAFERDLNRRLRAMGQCELVWAGLELHLVASSNATLPTSDTVPRALLPPPAVIELPVPHGPTARAARPVAATPRSWATRTMGLVLLVAAGGAVYDGVSRWLAAAAGMPAAAGHAQLDGLKGSFSRELRSSDAVAVRAWLSRGLGVAVPLPPQPGDFRLIGSHLERLGGEDTGVLTYRRNGSISEVYLRPTRARDQMVALDGLRQDLQGRARSSWSEPDIVYALTTPISPDLYQPLVQARWSPR